MRTPKEKVKYQIAQEVVGRYQGSGRRARRCQIDRAKDSRAFFLADVEYLCERQEVLKDLVVSKKDTQRTALEDCQRKMTRS